MKNRFKIEIIGREEIKDEEWGALLLGVVDYVDKLKLKYKFHVHLQEIKKEEE
jgi:hypothetical protein